MSRNVGVQISGAQRLAENKFRPARDIAIILCLPARDHPDPDRGVTGAHVAHQIPATAVGETHVREHQVVGEPLSGREPVARVGTGAHGIDLMSVGAQNPT